MRHKTAFSLLALMVVLSAAGWGVYRNSRINRMFNSVRVKASEQQVVQILGKPSWVEPCGKSFGPQLPNCREYIYRDSFAPLVPQYWSVRFDSSGHVLDTDVYQSP
jgi:hypothetical protein